MIGALIVIIVGVTPARAAHGGVQQYTYNSATGAVHYLVYTPSTYDPARPAPLVVLTHGCNTTAAQQEAASIDDPIAEQNRFVVMYPDDDDSVHPVQCWRFYDKPQQQRDSGDVATIAGMTRAVMAMRNIDRQRVYEIGMSSGALITSDLAAAYPDLYTAIGIMAGGPYGTDSCLTGQNGAPSIGDVSQAAAAAFAEEGPRARVMPFIVLNGDMDHTVSPGCGQQAVDQWVRTDNLVVSGKQTGPIGSAPAADRPATVTGGHSYDVLAYRGADGCVLGEHWVIHGMDHFWSGGTTDPMYAQFTDPKGPSASAASWAFFSRFRLAGRGLTCADGAAGPNAATPATAVSAAMATAQGLANTSAGGASVDAVAWLAIASFVVYCAGGDTRAARRRRRPQSRHLY
jgi:poly(hydroxyalkanoate) depolymerase family esterase